MAVFVEWGLFLELGEGGRTDERGGAAEGAAPATSAVANRTSATRRSRGREGQGGRTRCGCALAAAQVEGAARRSASKRTPARIGGESLGVLKTQTTEALRKGVFFEGRLPLGSAQADACARKCREEVEEEERAARRTAEEQTRREKTLQAALSELQRQEEAFQIKCATAKSRLEQLQQQRETLMKQLEDMPAEEELRASLEALRNQERHDEAQEGQGASTKARGAGEDKDKHVYHLFPCSPSAFSGSSLRCCLGSQNSREWRRISPRS